MIPRLSSTASRDQLLGIYLQDHDAVAAAAIALAERAVARVRHENTRQQLDRIATELVEDREVLRQVMATLRTEPATWKVVAARVAERVGRLKLNGQVLRSSALGNVWDMEGLLDVVAAKRRLWQAIAEVPGLEDTAGINTDEMLQRLESQLDRLHPLWLVATSTAFPGTPPLTMSTDDGGQGTP